MKRLKRCGSMLVRTLVFVCSTHANAGAQDAGQQQRWAAFPIIASSPETGQMLGGMLFYFFPTDKPGQQASTIDIQAYGTTKNQYAMGISPNLYVDNGRYRVNAKLAHSIWQGNFYTLGSNSSNVAEKYKATDWMGNLTLERRLDDTYVISLLGVYDKAGMETQNGGQLQAGVSGGAGGTYVGAGVEAGYDTRDNTNAPSQGHVLLYRNVRHGAKIGSDSAFVLQNWELRMYRQPEWLSRDSVLAVGLTVRRSSGDVPFRFMPSPDGTSVLRGIENGRYRDKDMLAFQSEYRFPVQDRFSATVFAEAAQVAPTLGEIRAGKFKTSIGAGFRYALNPSQRFNLRADIAWVDHGMGMIINIREAF